MDSVSMNLERRVSIFEAQHAALTRELDELEPAGQDLRNSKSAHDLICKNIAAAERHIFEGCDKLKRDWRARSADLLHHIKRGPEAQAAYQRETNVYQQALAQWEEAEQQLVEAKHERLGARKEVSEAQRRVARHTHLVEHLDHLHDVVFEGIKIVDRPESKVLEWETRCALSDQEKVNKTLNSNMTTLQLINVVYSLLDQIERHYIRISEHALEFRMSQ
ncbi:hypothetical protein BKA62DRAFT_700288 [Auriculariales sp. MPI-PUGE-AT-0066]|nr:hypothetical protein BKA62DRAFT_700288 [Auriculariales sp. MPI-PUGE-AT-0066]